MTNLVIGSVAAEASWQHDGEPAARQAVHDHLRANGHLYPAMAELSPQTGDWTVQFMHSAEFLLAGFVEKTRS